MKSVFAALGLCVAIVCASPAYSQSRLSLSIPAQSLDSALIALGRQANVTIGGVDTRLASARSSAVHGNIAVEQALRIMLKGTGFTFRAIDHRTFKIIRDPAPVRPKPHPVRPSPPLPAPPVTAEPPPAEIIVTATKQGQSLDSYAGSIHIERAGSAALSEQDGADALVRWLPVLSATDLGIGRNKLFVRGVADSSFSGPTQSTVGQYLGEMRITYNAPDPDLRLYDIDQVEVIEGPQGTLYGAGSLGGIVKIMPNAPQADKIGLSASAGRSLTQNGAPGFDGSGMINLPIVKQVAALRVVGFYQQEGGYINNSSTREKNTNLTNAYGGRASLRIQPGNDWTVEFNGLLQDILAADAQYAQINLPARTHAANFAQTHDNDIRGLNFVLSKKWNNLKLVSSTGYIDHLLDTRYDATGYLLNAGVSVLDEAEQISLLTHETRLSGRFGSSGTWVGGISLVRSIDRVQTLLAPLGTTPTKSLLRNKKQEVALFGEATRPFASVWAVMLGGRLVYTTTESELIRVSLPDFEPILKQGRFLPTAALSWSPKAGLLAYLRYQSGFRAGGLAEGGPLLDDAIVFAADRIDSLELGLRFGRSGHLTKGKFAGSIAASLAHWRDVQADIISAVGLPYTSNIGHARILGLEVNADWMPFNNLKLGFAGFANHNRLTVTNPSAPLITELRLPNIANLGARASFAWTKSVSDQLTFNLDGIVRYVGVSKLGTQVPLLLPQGDYAKADLVAALLWKKWRLSLEVSNLFNVSANTFSFGNPFTVAQGNQVTPLRPRTVRLGLHFQL